MPWDTIAELHGIEAEKIRFYQVTNQELVATGRLQSGMCIVDLACGTGLTTRTILRSMHGPCTIYAVDGSVEMLREMANAVSDPSIHFVHSDAGAFARYILQPIDRVFCNSAFWHFTDASSVLGEIRKTLKRNGIYLFNLPGHDYDFGDGKESEMARAIRTCLNQPRVERDLPYSYPVIRSLAAACGFHIADRKTITIELRPEDLIRLCTLPPIGAPGFPGGSIEQRREMVTRAFTGRLREPYPRYRWVQFALTPIR